jgi:protein tyrosine/serine phosphatase
MQIDHKFQMARLLGLALVLFTFAAIGLGQEGKSQNFANIKVKNFGQLDDRFYRGGQPKEEDYASLAALGINTIIDLRDEPEEYGKAAAEAAGMRYVNIPMVDKAYPKTEDVNAFLTLVNDPQTGKFFVHCAGGRHRTGIMGAVYRFTHYNWNYDQVYNEMKQYDFYSRWGHGAQKRYVQEYWANHQQANPATAGANAASTVK